MQLEEIEKLWALDCKIDRTDLATESLKIPEIHNKYFKIYSRERLLLKNMLAEHAILQKQKWEYYNGKLDFSELKELGWDVFDRKVLKSDTDLYIQSDKDIIESNLSISYQKEKVEYLEQILEGLKSRTWNIRNAIEFIKFTNGI
jgi:hypothetical protein